MHDGPLPPPSTLPAPPGRPPLATAELPMPDLERLPITPHSLDLGSLSAAQTELWASLPPSYQRFLRQRNGGLVNGGEGGLCFYTGIPYCEDGIALCESQIDEVEEFLGFTPPPRLTCLPGDLEAAKYAHDEEGFLPFGILAIANCCGGSLVCISILPDDFGAIYFWDYYWDYPWSEDFFAQRIAAAEQPFSDIEEIRDDPSHPRRRAAADAINRSILVRLAGDFDTWIASCWCAALPRGVKQ